MIQTIQKRDGRVVPFDLFKVQKAVSKAAQACGYTDDRSEHVAEGALRVAEGRHGQEVAVEQMQDAVEVALMLEGWYDVAKAYILYRSERAKQRHTNLVTPEVRESFRVGAESMGNDPLRIFQFYDKYSRWNGERRETWPETVDRDIGFLRLLVRQTGRELPESMWEQVRTSVMVMESMPSMRLVAMAGPAAERDHVSIYNCAYQVIDALESIVESLLISMAGCGDGYSVESQFVRKLPFVQYQRQATPDVFVVPDSSLGWGQALGFGLERWFDGYDVEYDFSQIRLAGALLKTKGGRASGPRPLRDMLRFIRELILSRQGMQLRPVDVNDVMTMTGEAGNSGGVRRAAKISISDWLDLEMEQAKAGKFWKHSPWRQNANNSAAWPAGGPSQIDFVRQMSGMFASGSGERGIFSRENALRTMPAARAEFLRQKGAHVRIGCNPCGEIILQDKQFCNLSIAVARPDDNLADLVRKVRVATILGTIQSTATHFPYLRPEWKSNCEEERLLGVDVTGQMDVRMVRDPVVLETLKRVARAINRETAAILGIRESAAITANKPSGNSSALLDCAPGINARKIRYGIRNARTNTTSPTCKALRACDAPMDPENGQSAETADTWVVHFPMAAPEGAIVAHDMTALDQLEQWKLNKLHYTEHNPSCTIDYGPDELIQVMDWVWQNRDIIGGLSFMPKDNTVYQQLPYQETSKEEYERALAAFPKIDWSMIVAYELEDMTTQAQERACMAGGCET